MILRFITIILAFFICSDIAAQTDPVPVAGNTIKESRQKEYRNLVTNSINSNLSIDLTDSTEENWESGFSAMELLQYSSPFINNRIQNVFGSLEKRSIYFQRSFLELIYAVYPGEYVNEIASFINLVKDPKVLAMCAEYIFMNGKKDAYKTLLLKRVTYLSKEDDNKTPFLSIIKYKLLKKDLKFPPLTDFFKETYLQGEVIMFSFQRKNRNYPGLVMIRGKDGLFIKDENGNYFSVPQLARSTSNMPGYITNGNTPQGIFKITGLGNSKGIFIGPTTNIQLLMPFEKSSDVPDSVTELFADHYTDLLPGSWKDYYPVYEAYYAGKAGRTEIIAHGTTVNPEYYKKQSYYPLTPTQGCLCTKELWNDVDGRRTESDQQKLIDALKRTGSLSGYCIVIEIDDQEKPVSISEILPYLTNK